MEKTLSEKVLALVGQRGIVRPRDLERQGIPREYLLRLLRQGVLNRLGRGLYELAETAPTEEHSLAVIAKQAPQGVICLLSALRFHGLTTQQSPEVWVGIPTRAWHPRLSGVAYRVIRYSEMSFSAGVESQRIEGVTVRIFNPAKTIADCFKYRSKIGLDVALEALRDALRERKATVDEIEHYAKLCRVSKVIRPYLEASV